ncbi:MAG: hypothetical protein LBJ61_12630 [Deltaproteobacteria bacterium]|nr:hypothetical protein [Deltaproteobacteria bacterium]
MFDNDVITADKTFQDYNSKKIKFAKRKINHVLYLECNGAMLHTREKSEEGSPWKENKLGLVFSTDNITWYKNTNGEREHKIRKREY